MQSVATNKRNRQNKRKALLLQQVFVQFIAVAEVYFKKLCLGKHKKRNRMNAETREIERSPHSTHNTLKSDRKMDDIKSPCAFAFLSRLLISTLFPLLFHTAILSLFCLTLPPAFLLSPELPRHTSLGLCKILYHRDLPTQLTTHMTISACMTTSLVLFLGVFGSVC